MRHRAGRGRRGRAARRRRVRRRRIRHARQRRAGRRRARPAEPRGLRPRQHRAARGLPAAAGCAGRRGPPRRALEGQGHDDRPLGADGGRHAAGVSDLPARLPARGDRPVRAPHRPRRARQQAGVRHRDHRGARRGAQRTGKRIVYTSADSVFQIAAHEDTSRSRSSTRLRDRARDPDRRARRRARDRAAVRRRARRYARTPNRHDFSLEPKHAELPVAHPRRGRRRCTASARSATSSRAVDIDESHPTQSNVDGINQTSSCSRSSTRA